MLIALRLALGCHFLYEGVWKIKPFEKFSTHAPERFTAAPFLTQAKGPLSKLFYLMVPDIDGRGRLRVETMADGKKAVNSDALIARWTDIRKEFVDYYQPAGSGDKAAREQLEQKANEVFERFQKQVKDYFAANVEEIAAYFESLDRFENDPEGRQGAPFQKQRRWERMMALRGPGEPWSPNLQTWINELEAQEAAYQEMLYGLIDREKQKELGRVPYPWWNPLRWTQMELLDYTVTYALTAIGACLILGLCSRLAALGGAGFMCFVVMTQPAFPGIYPPDPAVVGHAILINKDFIEMLSLLVVATVPAGRWGGLDFFLYHVIFNPLVKRFSKK